MITVQTPIALKYLLCNRDRKLRSVKQTICDYCRKEPLVRLNDLKLDNSLSASSFKSRDNFRIY